MNKQDRNHQKLQSECINLFQGSYRTTSLIESKNVTKSTKPLTFPAVESYFFLGRKEFLFPLRKYYDSYRDPTVHCPSFCICKGINENPTHQPGPAFYKRIKEPCWAAESRNKGRVIRKVLNNISSIERNVLISAYGFEIITI